MEVARDPWGLNEYPGLRNPEDRIKQARKKGRLMKLADGGSRPRGRGVDCLKGRTVDSPGRIGVLEIHKGVGLSTEVSLVQQGRQAGGNLVPR
ncbi:hypothetical protein NDU88_003478 [Pleurodeles waltl]|uniref:Uncharacterized protein n=1 Tax=Pleurodeles waltl TaxID=8319 RepID=A0AAV7MTJ9_PLEWA|nr:hypothetical protein NDU88_003478 [Pleurodeles waltl]